MFESYDLVNARISEGGMATVWTLDQVENLKVWLENQK